MNEVGKTSIKLASYPAVIDESDNQLFSSAPTFTDNYARRSFTTDQAATHLTRSGARFYDRNGDSKTDVSFRLEGFNEQQKHCARRALQSWQDVATIRFQENAQGPDGSIQLTGSNRMTSGVAWGPTRQNPAARAMIGTQPAENANKIGSYFTNLLVHEIGHCLGLAHPGEYNGGGSYERDAVFVQDTRAGSVMSYWSERKQAGHNFKNMQPSAPMMYDIAAIQKLYGANLKTRDTDTTYGFNSNSGREAMSLANAADSAVFCVWDGGGNDTLDFSGYRQDQSINLNAESFSDVGGMKGNVSIAKGVTLENAVGGAGNDTLTGNEANNRLKGGTGADRLRGGGGADTFVYDKIADSTPLNTDLILDFTSGTDKVDVSGAMKEAGIKALNFTDRFSGRAGDAVLSHDPKTGRSSLAIDMSGSGKADLLVASQGEMKSTDILGGDQVPTPTPGPVPPHPAPEMDLLARLVNFVDDALATIQPILSMFEKVLRLFSGSGAGREQHP
ncbi:metalloprotease [Pseudomonas sp. ADAK18]|uniref:M10 family metallopeptidase C-terminal domain-containing protein n=1 Tax=Pseudomonas sp. ADAK18 TaxID=2730848 RepID=UPI001464424C|nr:M10 family metallopeptidase C-terminal domain-containing protein [Pseudomonas sp. ADAK18]QJI27998.1 metalloprotease [Pseudomonas sp. ADAK18]